MCSVGIIQVHLYTITYIFNRTVCTVCWRFELTVMEAAATKGGYIAQSAVHLFQLSWPMLLNSVL